MAVETPICDFGWKAPDFSLLGVDGKSYSLADVKGENATLVVFMCNHCPYVLAVLDRLIRDVKDLQALGVGVVAINANDPTQYPADSFDNMKAMATEHHFPFPYLFDDSQDVRAPMMRFALQIFSVLIKIWAAIPWSIGRIAQANRFRKCPARAV